MEDIPIRWRLVIGPMLWTSQQLTCLSVDDVFDPMESDEEEDNDKESVFVPWEVVANLENGSFPRVSG